MVAVVENGVKPNFVRNEILKGTIAPEIDEVDLFLEEEESKVNEKQRLVL